MSIVSANDEAGRRRQCRQLVIVDDDRRERLVPPVPAEPIGHDDGGERAVAVVDHVVHVDADVAYLARPLARLPARRIALHEDRAAVTDVSPTDPEEVEAP